MRRNEEFHNQLRESSATGRSAPEGLAGRRVGIGCDACSMVPSITHGTLAAITKAPTSTDASSRQPRINHRGCNRALNRIFNADFINCLSLEFLLFEVLSQPHCRADPSDSLPRRHSFVISVNQ